MNRAKKSIFLLPAAFFRRMQSFLVLQTTHYNIICTFKKTKNTEKDNGIFYQCFFLMLQFDANIYMPILQLTFKYELLVSNK